MLHPLYELLSHTSSNAELVWSDSTNSAFTTAKETLSQDTSLYHPVPGATMTDASDMGTGVVLQQFHNEHWQPIAYYSQTLSHKTEIRYL